MAKYKFSLEHLDGQLEQVAIEFTNPEEIDVETLHIKLNLDENVTLLTYVNASNSFKQIETQDDLDLLSDGARLKIEKKPQSRKRSNSGHQSDNPQVVVSTTTAPDGTPPITRERKASKSYEDSSPSDIISLSRMDISSYNNTGSTSNNNILLNQPMSEQHLPSSTATQNTETTTLVNHENNNITNTNDSSNQHEEQQQHMIIPSEPTPPSTPIQDTPLAFTIPIDDATTTNSSILSGDSDQPSTSKEADVHQQSHQHNSKMVEEEEENNKDAIQIVYNLTPEEKQEYRDLFRKLDTDEDGFVDLFDINTLFSDSGLETPILKKIWNLVDTRQDERLEVMGYSLMKCIIPQVIKAMTSNTTSSSPEENQPQPQQQLPSKLSEEFWRSAKADFLEQRGSGQRGRSMSAEEEQELEMLRASRVRRGAFYNPLANPQGSSPDTPHLAALVNASTSTGAHSGTSASFQTVVVDGIELTVELPANSSSGSARPTKKPKMHSEGKIRSESSRLKVGYADTIGKRPSMEDEMVMIGHFRGNVEEEFIGVYDGHGGNDASVFASKKLHEVLIEELNETGSAKRSLKSAFIKTNALMKEANIRGGTTAIVALTLGSKMWIANAGDCRAVVCKAGAAIRCSTDHKPSLPSEHKRITDMGGYITTSVDRFGGVLSRVCGVLSVARALGDFTLQPYVSPEPEVFGPISIDPSNRIYFLILACDGVWDKVTDEEAVSIVAPIPDPEKAAAKLRNYALAKGSEDNISTIIIRFPPFS